MAFGSSITAYFGGDTSGLKKAVGEAQAEVARLNASMGGRMEHKLISGIIGAEALRTLKTWVSESIKAAQETRNEFERMGKPIDDDTARLANFGDALESLKKGAVSSVGFIVAQLNHAGEAFGTLINRIRGISAAEEKLNETTGRDAVKAEEALAAARKKNSPEKIAAAEKELAKVRRDDALAGMDARQKEATLLKEIENLQKTIDGTIVGTLPHIEAELEMEKLKKELLQDEVKIGTEEAHLVNEYSGLKAKLLKMKEEELPLDVQKAHLEADILDLQRETAKEGEKDINGVKIAIELRDKEKELNRINLEITKEEAKEEGKIVKTLQAQAGLIAGIRGGGQFNTASTETLREVARRNRAQARDLLNPALGQVNMGNQLEAARLTFEAQNAEKIIADRDSLGRKMAVGGIEAARRSFKGDPLRFDEVMQQVTKSYGTQEKMLTEQTRTNSILQKFVE
jgi:hypothetical protein